jgi:hypothetical protein
MNTLLLNTLLLNTLLLRFVAVLALLLLAGCGGEEKLPKADSDLLDPNGNFTLYVTNQSYAIDRVDIRVEIDDALVVSEYFNVGTQHTFEPFKLTLSQGMHKIHVWSELGDVELTDDFDTTDHDVGVAMFWHNPKAEVSPNRRIDFNTQVGPFQAR